MSTEIGFVKGRREIPIPPKTVEYEDIDLYVTRFAGGEKNGVMVQLTLSPYVNNGFIQLTKEQAFELIKKILDAYSQKGY